MPGWGYGGCGKSDCEWGTANVLTFNLHYTADRLLLILRPVPYHHMWSILVSAASSFPVFISRVYSRYCRLRYDIWCYEQQTTNLKYLQIILERFFEPQSASPCFSTTKIYPAPAAAVGWMREEQEKSKEKDSRLHNQKNSHNTNELLLKWSDIRTLSRAHNTLDWHGLDGSFLRRDGAFHLGKPQIYTNLQER